MMVSLVASKTSKQVGFDNEGKTNSDEKIFTYIPKSMLGFIYLTLLSILYIFLC